MRSRFFTSILKRALIPLVLMTLGASAVADEPDLVAQTVSFASPPRAALASGVLDLTFDGSKSVKLSLKSHHQAHGIDTLVFHDASGTSSVLTMRGTQFYMLLQLSPQASVGGGTESYRLIGKGQNAHAFDQRGMDARTAIRERDFQYVP